MFCLFLFSLFFHFFLVFLSVNVIATKETKTQLNSFFWVSLDVVMSQKNFRPIAYFTVKKKSVEVWNLEKFIWSIEKARERERAYEPCEFWVHYNKRMIPCVSHGVAFRFQCAVSLNENEAKVSSILTVLVQLYD